jgi:hypothetical protein
MVQLAIAASVTGQLFDCVKLADPVNTNAPVVAKITWALPTFVSVAITLTLVPVATVPKETDFCSETAGPVGPIPMPVSATVCVAGLALSVKVSVADSPLTADAVKMRLTIQLVAIATVDPFVHVVPLAMAKSAAFGPLTATVVRLRAALPGLESVTVIGVLGVPTPLIPKLSAVVDSTAPGPVEPVPVKVTICGEFEELSVIVNVAVRVPRPVGVKIKEMGQATCGL